MSPGHALTRGGRDADNRPCYIRLVLAFSFHGKMAAENVVV